MRIVKLFTGMAGLLALLVAVPVFTVGVGLLAWAGGGDRTELPTVSVVSDDRALVAHDIGVFAGERDRFMPSLAEASLVVTDEESVFVGVGPAERVDAFLADPTARPGDQDFWVDGNEGTAARIDWEVDPGRWSAVVMNADGTPGVDASVSTSVPAGPLRLAGAALAAVGTAIGIAGAALVVTAWGGRSAPTPTPAAAAASRG